MSGGTMKPEGLRGAGKIEGSAATPTRGGDKIIVAALSSVGGLGSVGKAGGKTGLARPEGGGGKLGPGTPQRPSQRPEASAPAVRKATDRVKTSEGSRAGKAARPDKLLQTIRELRITGDEARGRDAIAESRAILRDKAQREAPSLLKPNAEARASNARKAIESGKTVDMFGDENAAHLDKAHQKIREGRATGDRARTRVGIAEARAIGRERKERMEGAYKLMKNKGVYSVAHNAQLTKATEAASGNNRWKGFRGGMGQFMDGALHNVHVHHMFFKALYPGETFNAHNLMTMSHRLHTQIHRMTGGSPRGVNKRSYKEMFYGKLVSPKVQAQIRDYFYFHNTNSYAPIAKHTETVTPSGKVMRKFVGAKPVSEDFLKELNAAEAAAKADKSGAQKSSFGRAGPPKQAEGTQTAPRERSREAERAGFKERIASRGEKKEGPVEAAERRSNTLRARDRDEHR